MDIINIEILADGTIKFQTDSISQANHVSADEFLKEMEGLTGGQVTIEQREKGSKAHIHKKASATN